MVRSGPSAHSWRRGQADVRPVRLGTQRTRPQRCPAAQGYARRACVAIRSVLLLKLPDAGARKQVRPPARRVHAEEAARVLPTLDALMQLAARWRMWMQHAAAPVRKPPRGIDVKRTVGRTRKRRDVVGAAMGAGHPLALLQEQHVALDEVAAARPAIQDGDAQVGDGAQMPAPRTGSQPVPPRPRTESVEPCRHSSLRCAAAFCGISSRFAASLQA